MASELSMGGEVSGYRVCQHSEAMQWVQGVWRLCRRQWKRKEGSPQLVENRFSMPGKGLWLVAIELSVGGEMSG